MTRTSKLFLTKADAVAFARTVKGAAKVTVMYRGPHLGDYVVGIWTLVA